jgi:hypothetical protein
MLTIALFCIAGGGLQFAIAQPALHAAAIPAQEYPIDHLKRLLGSKMLVDFSEAVDPEISK